MSQFDPNTWAVALSASHETRIAAHSERSRRLMAEFRFVWHNSDAAVRGAARAFWQEIGAVMTPEEMDERTSQICVLAYEGGNLAAVSTTHLFDFPRLRSRFYYRTVVGPNFRRKNLASRLCVYSRDRLNEWAHEHPEENVKGLFIVLQADEFHRHKHFYLPVGRQLDLDLILVGYTTSGHQMRVVWFKDATVE